MTVDGPQITVLIRPLVPYGDPVFVKILDVGVTIQKPKQFIDNRFEMQFLGSENRKPSAQVKTHLMAEDALGSDASAIAAEHSSLAHMAKKIKILLHS